MKTILIIISLILLFVGTTLYVLGHYQIAFGIGFLLIVLFVSGNAYYTMENRDYLRKKAEDLQEKEREGWRRK